MPSLANNYVVYSGFWRLSRPWHALHVFPHLAPIARFPALGTDCSLSRVWYRLLVFPRLAPIIRFPALLTDYTAFSRALGVKTKSKTYQLLVEAQKHYQVCNESCIPERRKKIQRKRHLRWFLLATCSLPSTVSKTTTKKIGHRARKRDMTGQSYPIYACTRANHTCYSSVHFKFCGSSKRSLL